MLLLVTIGLVMVGAVSLVIGFATNALPWIYLSIACSVVAAGVLVLFSRMSRQAPAATGAGPAPLDTGEPTLATAAVEPETAPVVVPEGAASLDGEVPIADYDKLRVNEIMPKLAGLSAAELAAVRAREVGGKNRASVVSRIDDLLSQQEAAAAEAAAAGVAGSGAELAAAEVGASTGAAAGVGDELDNIDDLIEDYDKLSVNQILPLLGELDEDELEDVAAYEEDHKNRAAIIDRIDALLEGEELPAPAKAASTVKGTAKKSAVAKKVAAAKKSAAKVGAAAKKAAPAAKKAAATKKAAPAKAPAKKAAPAAAKKTAAKKAAAPAKKAAKATKAAKK